MATIAEILLAKGRDAAEARRQSGAVWSGAVQGLAQIPGAILQDHQEQQLRQAATARQARLDADKRTTDAATAARENTRLGLEGLRYRNEQDRANHQQAVTEATHLRDAGGSPEAVMDWVRSRTGTLWGPEEGGPMLEIASTPEGAQHILDSLAGPKPPEKLEQFDPTKDLYRGGALIRPGVPEVKPETRSLQVQANEALKAGNTGEYARLMKVIRDTGAAGRAPDQSPATMASLTEDDQKIVDGILDYRQVLPTGIAITKGKWPAYLEAAHVQDPNFDQSLYQVRQRLKQSFSSGKDADNIRGLNTAVGHLGSLATAMDAMGNGNFESVNSAKNVLATKLPMTKSMVERQGKQTKVRLDFNAVKGELAGIFKASGATDQEIKSWESTLPSDPAAATPEERKAFLEGTVELMGSRMGANRQKYESGMGGKAFPQAMLSPHSRDILQKLGIDVNGIDPTAQIPSAGPKKGDTKPIPGYPNAEQTFDGQKWIRTK